MTTTEIILIVAWIFVLIWVPIVIYSNKKTHPGALFVLFGAEMWERFSYYGMRALLVLYMTKVLFQSLGTGLADTRALSIYGSYTSLVYLFPVLGGLVADRYYGFKKSIIVGGVLMALGHFTLALEGMAFEGNLMLFFLSLSLIIIGNAYFKPNLSSFLGKFYELDDPRKDGAFTIYYMGVNIGAFLATLTCGYVGEQISWHYGFGLAGIGMTLGLILFVILGPKYFQNKGGIPNREAVMKKIMGPFNTNDLVLIITLVSVPLVAFILNYGHLMSTLLIVATVVIIGYMIYIGATATEKKEGQKLWVVVILFFFHAIFWALFEQAGGSLTLFTDRFVDRNLFGSEIPASIFQSLNPFYIMVFAPVFSWIWIKLSKRGLEPSTPMKFVLGLSQLGLGFAIIVVGIQLFQNDSGLVSVLFLFLMYLFHTTGELSLSPVGLSMITKLSPDKIVGFVMGAWFLSIALGNKIAGEIGKLTAMEHGTSGTALSIENYQNTYFIWGVVVVVGAALLLLLLVPLLRKWMHGIH